MSNYRKRRGVGLGSGTGKVVTWLLVAFLVISLVPLLFSLGDLRSEFPSAPSGPTNPVEDPLYPPVFRDISTGVLTESEKAVLSTLSAADLNVDIDSKTIINLEGFAPWAYSKACVDVSSYFNKSIFNVAAALFDKTNTKNWTLKSEVNTYTQMLVPGYYGGKVFSESKTFTVDDFEIGDLFCAYTQDSTPDRYYYVALYQGDGKFLLFNSVNGWKCFDDSGIAFDFELSTFFHCYFVLRPELLVQQTGD